MTSSCVKGICQTFAIDGAPCSPDSSNAPQCQPGFYCAPDTNKCEKYGIRGNGFKCFVGDNCAPNLACDGSFCTPNNLVSCNETSKLTRCKSQTYGGYCDCSDNPNEEGVCGEDPIICKQERSAYETCLSSSCFFDNRGQAYPYQKGGCIENFCNKQRDDLTRCLIENLDGYVPLPEYEPPSEPTLPSPKRTASISGAKGKKIGLDVLIVLIGAFLYF